MIEFEEYVRNKKRDRSTMNNDDLMVLAVSFISGMKCVKNSSFFRPLKLSNNIILKIGLAIYMIGVPVILSGGMLTVYQSIKNAYKNTFGGEHQKWEKSN